MGLEWHDRRRDTGGTFAKADENYNLHLHVRGITYDTLRKMALVRKMDMSSLVEELIWRFKEQTDEMKGAITAYGGYYVFVSKEVYDRLRFLTAGGGVPLENKLSEVVGASVEKMSNFEKHAGTFGNKNNT